MTMYRPQYLLTYSQEYRVDTIHVDLQQCLKTKNLHLHKHTLQHFIKTIVKTIG